MSYSASYSLSDLLLFSSRVYERLSELHNAALWPAHSAALLSGFIIVACVIRTTAWSTRVVYGLLGVAWFVVYGALFLTRYQTINWPAEYVAPIIFLEGVLLLALAVFARPPSAPFLRTPAGFIATSVLLFGLFGYPFVAPLCGRSFRSAEFFALTPDATAVVTLAVMALGGGKARWFAMIIPTAWCIVTGLSLWMLGWPDFFVAPLAASLSFGAAVAGRRLAKPAHMQS